MLKPRLTSLLAALISVTLVLEAGGNKVFHYLNHELTLAQRYVDGTSYVSYITANAGYGDDVNIVLLGASVTRESVPSEKWMEEKLTQHLAKEVNFLNLGSRNQAYDESLAILNTLDAPKGTLILQQVALRKLDKDSSFYRNQYLNPRFDVVEYGVLDRYYGYIDQWRHHLTPSLVKRRLPLLNYINSRNCNYRSLIVEEMRQWCTRPVAVKRSFYSQKTRLSRAQKKRYIEDAVNRRYKPAMKHYSNGLQYLKAMNDIAREKGYELAFVDYPVAPMIRDIEQRFAEALNYKKLVDQFRGKHEFLDYRFQRKFRDEDFQDTFHLIAEGKKEMGKLIINDIGRIMN